jgi:hypothetical protein
MSYTGNVKMPVMGDWQSGIPNSFSFVVSVMFSKYFTFRPWTFLTDPCCLSRNVAVRGLQHRSMHYPAKQSGAAQQNSQTN